VRHLIHVLVSIAMWCLFGYYWYIVLGREIGPSTTRAMQILALVVLAGLVVTGLWIAHNLRLARKFAGRRRGVRASPDPALAHDTIGRPGRQPGLAERRAAAIVDITADAEGKAYRIVPRREAP